MRTGALQFRLLGPLEAWRDGRPLRLGGERQRVLLALLVTHANELVTTDRLLEHFFGAGLSDGGVNAVHAAVSRLRRVLGHGAGDVVVATRPGGYVLRADPEQVDALMFERLLADGQRLLSTDEGEGAAARLGEALALWRGPALADLASVDCLQEEIRRLEELRLLATMERVDAELRLGRGASVIPDLERLVAANSLQERLRGQLMRALYGAGRQADALEVYRRTSELLRDELGLEPSPGLQELQRQVLRQDPALEREQGPTAGRLAIAPMPAVCPFRGLAPFDRSDAEFFCGRERLISDLLARLAESTLVGIVGPSGIGKSSLLRAGLLARLSEGALPGSASWRQILMRPGEHPCAELRRALGPGVFRELLARPTPSGRIVVAVDQLEELFTVCHQDADRAAFLEQLADAASDSERRVLIVVSLRADFYGRFAAYVGFARLLSSSHLLVGPMQPDELAEAIELPAVRAGLEVERRLVQRLVDDVAGEPGGLPLLSTTLLELWRVRDGRVLRSGSYMEGGGVRGAVARLAEAAYLRLDEGERRAARVVLLRLASGKESALVRRRVAISDFERIPGADRVLAALTDARLLTISDGDVEVSHEALLQEWPRYHTWLEEDHAGRQVQARLEESAGAWDAGGRDPGDLYRGARLAAALEWSAHKRDELSPREEDFLQASRKAAERATRRLRAVLAGVALLLVISLIAGVIALIQKQHATTEARQALAQQLGAEAVINPRIDLAMLLAREATNLDRSYQTESTLLATLLRSPTAIASFELPLGVRPLSLTLSPHGSPLLVGANNNHLYFYDPVRRRQERPPMGDFNADPWPIYSTDGSLLLLADDGNPPAIDVFRARTLRRLVRLRFDHRWLSTPTTDSFTESLAVSPDRRSVYYGYAPVTPSGAPGPGYLDRWALPSGRLLSSTRVSPSGLLAIRLVDRLPVPLVVLIALAAGLFNPAVAGGWTSQLPRIVTGPALDRGFALDAMTYSTASLAGPALAALIAAGLGARTAVITSAVLVALAVPSACWLSRYPPEPVDGPKPAPYRQVAAGFAAIVTRRPLLRATVTSVVSYAGIGMLLVCCPVLGAQRLGGSARGALLISAIAAASLVANWILARWPPRGQPDARVLASTLVIGASMAAAALLTPRAPGWLTLAAVALGGAGEGPQLTALFAVRHRESPEHMRGQIFTTAASLKIGGLAAGAALAGPLAARSVTACLLVAAGFELCAAAAYVLVGVLGGSRSEGRAAGSTARSV